MHLLQTKFATAEGEQEWCDALQALIEQGQLDTAEALLVEALEGLEGDVATLCRTTPREEVTVDGWIDLVEAVEVHEGDPITGVTLAIANDADLAFEKGRYHAPEVLLSLYTDEQWSWSAASPEELLAQCASDEPDWAGAEEDIEVFLEVTGLDALNTALLFHKQRFFFREGAPDHAPLRYVDFMVGSWWRALRFHQAVATELAARPLSGAVKLVTGLVEMRTDAVCLHRIAADQAEASAPGAHTAGSAPLATPDDGEGEAVKPADVVGSLSTLKVARTPVVEEPESVGGQIRRRLAEETAAEEEEEAPKRGLIARMFARK